MADELLLEPSRKSEALWRAWYNRGLRTLREADDIVRKTALENEVSNTTGSGGKPELELYRKARRWLESATAQAEGALGISVESRMIALAGQAWSQFQLKNLEDACSLAQQAIEVSEGTSELAGSEADRFLARSHSVLAHKAFDQQQFATAESEFNEALIRFRSDRQQDLNSFELMDVDPLDLLEVAQLVTKLAKCAYRTAKYPSAILAASTAVALLNLLSNQDEEIGSLLALKASAKVEQGQLRSAALVYAQWQRLQDANSANSKDYAWQARVFGYLQMVMGNYQQAQRIFRDAECALKCCDEDPLDLAKLARHQVRLASRVGDFKTGFALLPHSQHPEPVARQQLREAVLEGELSLKAGLFEQAEKRLNQATQLLEGGAPANLSDRVELSLQLGRLQAIQRDWRTSEETARSVLLMLEEEGRVNHPDMAQALWLVAQSRLLGAKDDATPICEEAIRILVNSVGQDSDELSDLLATRAKIHWFAGETEPGLETCRDALKNLHPARGRDYCAFARIETIRARLFHCSGNLSAAHACLDEAWHFWLSQEEVVKTESLEKSLTMLCFATVFVAHGDQESAEQLYQLLSKLLVKLMGGKKERVAFELNAYGNIYYSKKRHPEAAWLYQKAVENYEQSLGPEHPSSQQIRENYEKALGEL